MFEVTKDTRQGNVLSPKLFNICIDDLLRELYPMSDKVVLVTIHLMCLHMLLMSLFSVPQSLGCRD